MIHILVIDDAPDLLFLYHEAIARPNRTVTTADGIIALSILENPD